MPEDKKDQETETTPTGYKVPVPKRDEFFDNLKRASRPQPKIPPASAWNRKGSGRSQTPRGNSRGR
jgi:hypothetical protein